ncbi:MAG: hypothetical protein LBS31_03490, partial [Candidatus Adiutrix sp.]|nr:hypothetical protein [Candidatus Adiutrix sp.]
MTNELYPLILEPFIADPAWDDLAGRPLNALWLAADAALIAAGPQAGRTVDHLKHLWGERLVGAAAGSSPDAPLAVELKIARNAEKTALTVVTVGDSLWRVLEASPDGQASAGCPGRLNP